MAAMTHVHDDIDDAAASDDDDDDDDAADVVVAAATGDKEQLTNISQCATNANKDKDNNR